MRAVRLLLLWLSIVASFAFFGWFNADPYYGYTNDGPFYTNLRFEPALGFAVIGLGAASCILAGTTILYGVRSRRLARGWAVTLLVVSSMFATILPYILVRAIALGTQPVLSEPIEESLNRVHLFQHGWWFLTAPFHALWISLIAFIVFVVCIFRANRAVR